MDCGVMSLMSGRLALVGEAFSIGVADEIDKRQIWCEVAHESKGLRCLWLLYAALNAREVSNIDASRSLHLRQGLRPGQSQRAKFGVHGQSMRLRIPMRKRVCVNALRLFKSAVEMAP